jgi:hypothetical protein
MTIGVQEILANEALGAREKRELLEALRAQVIGSTDTGADPGIGIAEIEDALTQLRREAERGETPEAQLSGDSIHADSPPG